MLNLSLWEQGFLMRLANDEDNDAIAKEYKISRNLLNRRARMMRERNNATHMVSLVARFYAHREKVIERDPQTTK